MDLSPDPDAEDLAETGRLLAQRGWAPAGSGNYSRRRSDGTIAITVSGAHKARLAAADVMRIDAAGRPLDGRAPSAETALHVMIYQTHPGAQAVLHTHSIPAVVISRRIGPSLRLAGYELLKAFPGVDTHAASVTLPVFDNSQDMDALAAEVAAVLTARPAPAFLIRDHGLYGWGASLDEALRVVEAAETLIACELAQLSLEGKATT